jgi:type I restriction enzyme S subunit
MSGYEIVSLGNVCTVIAGQHITSHLYNNDGVGVPYLTGPADFGVVKPVVSKWTQVPKVFASEQDVLLTVKGNGVGKSNLGTNAAIGRQLMALRPGDRLDQSYLYHFIRSYEKQFFNMAQGATVPGIGKDDVAGTKIPLPPLEEQRRIAAILDKADAVRRKRKEAIALTEELLRSAFLEMFGDPVTNPKGWEVIQMAEVVSETQYGTADKANSEGEGIPILRMNNITYTGELDLDNLKWYSIAQKDEAKFTVRRGDLLFNRTNSPELVGKTAVWRTDEKYAFAGYLVRVRFKEEQALSEYVSAYLNSSYGKKYLFERAKPSINMSNFSASEFLKIPLPLPPIALQKHFVNVAEAARSSVKRLEEVVQDADNLFNSLLQRAFRGEL